VVVGQADRVVLLFGAASFVGAALLFLVEPMLAKLVLPAYGGSPMVWNTCTLFFQVLLLVGYTYVHVSTRRLGRRRQPWLHLALLVLPLVALPVLATTGPLLQRWFSWTGHRRADDPYFLYAASNAGSVVGLLGYPFLVEPQVGLTEQTRTWSWAYVGFVALVVACGVAAGVAARRASAAVAASGTSGATAAGGTSGAAPAGVTSGATPAGAASDATPTGGTSGATAASGTSGATPAGGTSGVAPVEARPAPPLRTRLGWVAVAFVPSSLMLGVTTHVSTDIAAIPLFWTVPLAIYLATFVVAFGRSSRRQPRTTALLAAAVVLPVMLSLVGVLDPPVWASVLLDLLLLALAGLAAHGRLAATRPDVEHLTGFYLLVSVGGVLGGLLNGLLAPALLDRPWEYPMVVALVPALALGMGGPSVTGSGLVRRLAREPLAVMSVLLLATYVFTELVDDDVLRRERTFFGSYRVIDASDRRLLAHGTTYHGWQQKTGSWVGQPTSYYARTGPIGNVMSAYDGTSLLDRVAFVGMGVGTLAAYGEPGRRADFYEIDPEVVEIARTDFDYLRRSAGDVHVVEGDGRLQLREARRGTYGLVVLDAFSSDAIPAHLLTEEAVAEYRRVLRPHGLLAFHVTNRHLDLVPVLAAEARRLGMTAVVRRDLRSAPPASVSTWVVLARAPGDLERLRTRPGWVDAEPRADVRAWTDDYSSLVEVLDVGWG
jgi:SAM-dependent methyltransferase